MTISGFVTPIAQRPFIVLLAALSIISATAATIEVTPLGTPAWMPVDLHSFSAPIGTAQSGYAEFAQTTEALLPPPNHQPHPALGVGPGDPHGPPYNQELAQGISNLGFVDKSTFDVAEFSNGLGIYLVSMLVPGPGSPTGSSPDFTSGPIIPNTLFPLQLSASTFRNGQLFSTPTEFTVPALDQINPPFLVDGHSHIPIFFADNFDFALNPALGAIGSYELVATITDAAGEGWQVTAPFQVVPEPNTLALLGITVAALGVVRRVRR